MKRICTVTSIVVLASITAALHAAPAPRPSSFYGTVTVGGSPVAAGTPVSAWVGDVPFAETGTFVVDGESVFRLDVPGDVVETAEVEGGVEGQEVVFRVGNAVASATGTWLDGTVARVDLVVAVGPDLAVSKDDGVTLARPGDLLTYTVGIANAGPGPATGIVLEDPLPVGTSFVSASDGGAESGSVASWPAFDLAEGASVTRTLTLEVATSFPAGTTEIANTANALDDGSHGADPDLAHNAATDTDALAGGADVVVTKSADLTVGVPGADLVYTITLENRGFQPATGVVLTDTLPSDVTFFTASDDGRAVGGVVTWPPVDVAVGEVLTRTVRVRIATTLPPGLTELVNSAEAPLTGDAEPADNRFDHVLPLAQQTDVAVVAVDASGTTTDPQSLAIGGQVAVELTNLGNQDAAGFDVALFEDRDGDGVYTAGADNLLGTASVALLAAGETTSLPVPVSGTVLFRDNRLFSFADSGDVLAELDETNNVGHSRQACESIPTPGDFAPVVELSWPVADTAESFSADCLSTPLVVQLTDDNGDGRRDERDVPDLVFVTYDLTDPFNPAPRLRAVRGDTGATIWDVLPPISGFFQTFALTGAAAGDIDLDGRPEIVVSTFDVRSPTGRPNRIAAYEHTGTLKWVSGSYSTHPDGDTLTNRDNPTIADLDGDGRPEIVVGANVFNADGSLRWAGTGGQGYQSARNDDAFDSGAISIVADLDLAGDPEVVTGNTAYRSDGTIWWQVPYDDGYPAVANFDADPEPEIVVVSRGFVRLHEHDGTLIWEVELPGAGAEAGGAPTVADFDGDGEPEIGVAGSTQYTVFEGDGSVKWQAPTQDGSSNMTGSTVFDLDGDGRFEVMYRDETALRIYRGEDGVVLYELPLSSTTLNEQPVVADVDRDGNAEIVVTSDLADGISAPTRTRGLRIIGDANDNWVAARPVWNQHAYHISNVAEDGHTIPAREDPSWLSHNTYRANVAPVTGAFASPDLSASSIRVDVSGFPEIRATVRIGNGGTVFSGAGTTVAFYDGDPTSGGALLGTVPVSRELDPGEYADVAFTFQASSFGAAELYAWADDDGTGAGSQTECDEANNLHGVTYDTDALGLVLAKDDGSDSVQPGEVVTYTLTVANAAVTARTGVALTDTLPPDTTVVAASDGGTRSGATVTWPTFDLAGGAVAVRTLTLQVDPAIPLGVGTLTNTATVTDDGSAGPDPTPANNTATDTDRVLTVRADAGGPYSGDEGAPIAFDGSGSSDRDGTVVSYEWDLDGDGQFDDATGATPSWSFPEDGTFTVALRVTDDSGEMDVDAAEVAVANLPAAVEAGADRTVLEGGTLAVTGDFVDPGVADLHTGTIGWGDGTVAPAVITEADGAGSASGTHVYPDDGVFTVEICISDDGGASACDRFVATVENGVPLVVETAEVDLATWSAENLGSAANWVVATDGQSVTQTRNSGPSVFVGPFPAIGVVLEGSIRVDTTSDDDFIGFVLGYQPGDFANPEGGYLLLDWKQANQDVARRGLALSRIYGTVIPGELWAHNDSTANGSANRVEELQRGFTRGNTGWADRTTYHFRFQTSPSNVKVWVNDVLEIDVGGDFGFAGGRFGFYNYSQQSVTYSTFTARGVSLAEGGVAEIALPFSDPGVEDVHTATIDWRDGTVEPGTVEQGSGGGTVTGSHIYADDAEVEVEVCVSDDDGGTGCGTVPVTVLNVPPTVVAGPDRLAYVGEGLEVAATFQDPGIVDTYTATIDWGDGASDEGTVEGAGGTGSVTGAHSYAQEGVYTVQVCVSDDDGGTGCDTFAVTWLVPVVDVAVSKTANRKAVRPDELVTYTITVANLGTREPRDLVVTDLLPAGLAFVGASSGASFDSASKTVVWTLPVLPYLASTTLTLSARAAPAVVFGAQALNTVTVFDDGRFGADRDPSNNAASAGVTFWDGVTPRVVLADAVVVVEGETFQLAASFDDTTSGEAHTATIDWGDGTVEPGSLSGSTLSGTVSGTHLYLDDLESSLEVCVTDAAGNTGCDAVPVTVANAAPRVNDARDVDLRLWSTDHYDHITNQGRARWNVSADGSSVLQVINSRPSIFYGDFPAFGTRIKGKIRVETVADDDYIGFALGYHPGDVTNPDADFLLLDWKQNNQGNARRGMAISHITGPTPDNWAHTTSDSLQEIARAIHLGDVGWKDLAEYEFTFEFSATRLRVFVDGVLEFDLGGTFQNGRLAFYNYSQERVRYSAFTRESLVVDEGEELSFRAEFVDDGRLDTHEATIDWADGETSVGEVTIADGIGSVEGTHAFPDDGLFPVEVCATDDDGGTGCGTFPVTVRNVAPTVEAGEGAPGFVAVPFSLGGATFTDPGTADTHTATVSWGDGSTTEGAVNEQDGAGAVAASHVYQAAGSYPVEVCVTDDDGGTGCDALQADVIERPPEVAIGDATVDEGDEGTVEARFPLTLSFPAPAPVTVSYATVDGSALAGEDYTAASGTVTIPTGAAGGSIVVEVLGDRVDELDETFLVRLSAPPAIVVVDGEAVGTIVDDDTAAISIDDVTVEEGDAGTTDAVFTISLATEADREIRVSYATAEGTATEGEDYLAFSGELSFPAGETEATVAVPVVGDLLLEPDEETFFVDLSDPVEAPIADERGVGTILDDELCPGPNLLVNPGAEARPVDGEIPGWTEVEGSDWQWWRGPEPAPYEGAAAFFAGHPAETSLAELVQDVDLAAYGERIAAGGQRFAFEGFLRTTDEVPPDVARIVVEYRDAAGLVLDAFDTGEITSPAEWLRVADERAAPPAATTVRVRLLAARFTGDEADAFFDSLSFRSLRAPALAIGDVAVYEGDSGTTDAIFPVTLSCPYYQEVTTAFATADGTAVEPDDYLAASGVLAFPPGETEASIPVPVVGDLIDEPDETFFTQLSGATPAGEAVLADPLGVGTILNDDWCPRTRGYWKNHVEAWPMDFLLLGGVEYDAAGVLELLRSGGPDPSTRLGSHLAATKLNLARGGRDRETILPTVEAADAFLMLYPPGSGLTGALREDANRLKDLLDQYNNGNCEGR